MVYHQERDSPFGLVNALRGSTEMCTKVKVDQVLCGYSIIMHSLAMECLISFASLHEMCSIQCMGDIKPLQVFLVMGYGAVENHK